MGEEKKILEGLKELYLDEIKSIKKKGELTPTDGQSGKLALEALDKIEDLCEKYEMKEDGHSEMMYPNRRYQRMPNDGTGYAERMYPQYMMNDGMSMNHMPRTSMMPDVHYEYGDGYHNDGGYGYHRNYYQNDGYSNRRGRSSVTGRYVSRANGDDDMVIDDMIQKLEGMKGR